MPEELSLNKKTFIATLWTVGSRMSVRFIGLISLVILAKILGPEDYGLVGKAAIIHGFLELVTALGLEAALITNQKTTKDHYSSAWTIHIMRGALIALILVALAEPASVYMKEARLELIIYCYAVITFFKGFYNIGVVDFRKKMNFSKDFYYSLFQKITGFTVTITIAVMWETYWALIAGIAASTITQLISSYWMSSMRPKITLSEFGSLFNFSKWMMIREVIDAVSEKMDGFLISIYSTTANVGIYNMSYEIASTPTSEIAMPVARACTPGFSKIQNNREKFSTMYAATLCIVMVIISPAAIGVSLLAEPIVYVALDRSWVAAIPVIQVLALYGFANATLPIFISAALALNRPDILTKLAAFKLIYTIPILVLSIQNYGLMGLIWGVFICAVFRTIIAQSIMIYMNILSIGQLVKNLWRTIVASGVMAAGLYYLLQIEIEFLDGLLAIELFFDVIAGAILYTVSLVLLWLLSARPDGPEKAILGVLLKGRWGTA